MKFFTDVEATFSREIVPELRNPFGLLVNMVLPFLFLIFFGPLLSGMGGTMEESPWQWFLPGILVMIALSGTLAAGANLLGEMTSGSFERMLVTPVSRVALLLGRTFKEVVTLALQAVILTLILLPTDFQPHPGGALLGLLMLAVFGVGVGAFSYALALVSKNQEGIFYGVQQLAFFIALLTSGILLPMEQAPSWLYAFSRINPASYVVEGERALFAGQILDMTVVYGWLVTLAVAVLGLAVGSRLMRRAAV